MGAIPRRRGGGSAEDAEAMAEDAPENRDRNARTPRTSTGNSVAKNRKTGLK